MQALLSQVASHPSHASTFSTSPAESGSSGDFRPTRRVRTAPGGETHDIFGHYVDDDALASAPPRAALAPAAAEPAQNSAHGRYALSLCHHATSGVNIAAQVRVDVLLGREQQRSEEGLQASTLR